MTRFPRLFAPVLALTLAVLALAGCREEPIEQEWSADLTSAEQALHQAGPDNVVVYGWNRLVGETTIDGETVQVEMLGNVAYRHGEGPFFGFVTLTFPDGSTLGMEMEGESEAGADTSQANFTSKLTILGGTGRYLEAKGSGHWEGGRDARLGGLVHMDVSLELRGVDK